MNILLSDPFKIREKLLNRVSLPSIDTTIVLNVMKYKITLY